MIACQIQFVADAGFVPNEASVFFAIYTIPNCYFCPNWKLDGQVVITHTAANTYCRTPGMIFIIFF